MSRMMNPLASSPISVVSSACSFVWGTLLVGRLIPTLWWACSAPLSLPRPAPTLALLFRELGQGPALLCVQPCGCSPQVGYTSLSHPRHCRSGGGGGALSTLLLCVPCMPGSRGTLYPLGECARMSGCSFLGDPFSVLA